MIQQGNSLLTYTETKAHGGVIVTETEKVLEDHSCIPRCYIVFSETVVNNLLGCQDMFDNTRITLFFLFLTKYRMGPSRTQKKRHTRTRLSAMPPISSKHMVSVAGELPCYPSADHQGPSYLTAAFQARALAWRSSIYRLLLSLEPLARFIYCSFNTVLLISVWTQTPCSTR